MKNNPISWLNRTAWIYFAIVFGWFFTYLGFGDRFGVFAVINSLAVYLFFPIPLFIAVVFFTRQKGLWAGVAGVCFVFIWLWGGLFIPKQRAVYAHPDNNGYLSVMTYNLLGWQSHTADQIEVIRKEGADVVMLQELNASMAKAIETELKNEYPYRILAPAREVSGMGVISRYPLHPTGQSLNADNWVGTPQALTLAWRDRQVTLVNIHMTPTGSIIPQAVEGTSRNRELQAQAIMDFIQGKEAVIVAGDTNTTPLSDAYKIMTSDLHDSWREAGFGFGHTFPGSKVLGSSRPVVFGIPSPQWLVRIDYIFHTNRWRALSSRIAQFDGVSDHRGVVAILDWVE